MEPVEVLPNLWAGSIEYATNRKFLESKDIKHVLSLCYDKVETINGIDHKQLEVSDDPDENITRILAESVEYIRSAIKSNEPIYVHCVYGRCRTACIVTAYIAESFHISIENAYKDLVSKYDRAMIYPIFLEQLKRYNRNPSYKERVIVVSYEDIPILTLPKKRSI